ncbi:hypothetical protein CSOJ01_01554 [Colletotrichum sojae]|uniref:Uncharacterized protein n=1 Tax=Colletotrichum sojae TaxID=2175907 RepID=A0A8H6N3P9_9PEZI|nr:hypothetical protein CSOJ01_01554 [Colletotrichum sojae]
MGYRSPTTPVMSPDAVSIATTNRPLLSEDSYFDGAEDKSDGRRSRRPWHIQVGESTGDGPKRVIRKDAPRLLTSWIAHAPALAVTCFVIWMSHSQIFWYPESGPDVPLIGHFGNKHTVVSNFLQFASKLHELMIVASLAALSLSMSRRRLVGKGLRLGFLTGGYRVGDLAYLTSGAFWGLGRDLGSSEVILVAFVVFGTIMSTIVGPASAILFVPSLGWYDMPKAFDGVRMPLAYSLDATMAWPKSLGSEVFDGWNLPECLATEGIFQSYCAPGGFTDIWNWLGGFRYTDLDNNVTFLNQVGRRLELSDKNSVALFTTPSSFAMNSIGLFTSHIQRSDMGLLSKTHRYKLTTTTLMKQPFVQGKCAIYDKDELRESGSDAVFPTTSLNCYGDADCLSLQRNPPRIDPSFWNAPGHNTSTPFDLHYNAAPQVKTVMQVAGVMPYASKDMEQKTWVYACSFLARWVPSNLTVDPQVSNIMESSVSSPATLDRLFTDSTPQRESVIEIQDSWLDYIDPLFNVTVKSVHKDPETLEDKLATRLIAVSPMHMILNRFLYEHETPDGRTVTYFDTIDDSKNPELGKRDTESFLAKAYGVFLTDSLARISSHEQTFLLYREDRDNTTWIDLAVQNGLWSGAHSYLAVPGNDTHPSKEVWNGNFEETPLDRTVEQMAQGFRDFVQIDFKAERHGYGSGQQSKTLHFALVMMYIYLGAVAVYGAAVVLSHVLHLLRCAVAGTPVELKSVAAWGDLQDLVLLALRSEPPPRDGDLKHVGAGVVRSSGVWNKVAQVRVGDDNALQLVLDDRGGMLAPRKGVKYS